MFQTSVSFNQILFKCKKKSVWKNCLVTDQIYSHWHAPSFCRHVSLFHPLPHATYLIILMRNTPTFEELFENSILNICDTIGYIREAVIKNNWSNVWIVPKLLTPLFPLIFGHLIMIFGFFIMVKIAFRVF